MVRGAYSDFSGWSYAGNGRKVGELSVVNQVLAISGRLSQRLLFGFLDWIPQAVTWLAELVTEVMTCFLGWRLQTAGQGSGRCPLVCSVSQPRAFNAAMSLLGICLRWMKWAVYKATHCNVVLREKRKD